MLKKRAFFILAIACIFVTIVPRSLNAQTQVLKGLRVIVLPVNPVTIGKAVGLTSPFSALTSSDSVEVDIWIDTASSLSLDTLRVDIGSAENSSNFFTHTFPVAAAQTSGIGGLIPTVDGYKLVLGTYPYSDPIHVTVLGTNSGTGSQTTLTQVISLSTANP